MISLSIIIPVFGVEKYICTCLKSIYKQGLDEDIFEVIIVNDGTKDKSIDVIQDIIRQHNNTIVIEQKNQGSWVARNTGMNKASGEYILFLDPDDLLIESSLKPLLEKALETETDIIVADYLMMNDEEIEKTQDTPLLQRPFSFKEKTGEQLFIEDLNPHHCYIWRSLFKRKFLTDNQLTFIPEFYYQDVPFLHKCYLMANRCLRTPWLMTIYRRGHESATYSFNQRKEKIFCIAIAKTWELKNLPRLNSPAVLTKLMNDVYTSFSVMLCSTVHAIKDSSERVDIIDYLKQIAPDLQFNNGIKQKIVSLIYNYFPHTFIQLRYYYGKIVEDIILPFYYHKFKNLL